MSKLSTHEFAALIIRSRSFLGAARWGATEGSMRALSTRPVVVLAEPCSPWSIRMG